MLPILCGSFFHYVDGQANIEDEPQFKAFVELLRQEMTKQRTLVVAAGDLAHLGPEFDGPPLDIPAQAQMEADDAALMNVLCQGNADSFLKFMQAGQHKRNVCGLSSFYFLLDILGQTHGQTIAYDRCLADYNRTSFVSICGIVLE
jgi:AmmeMemoRadiSam system protein B